MDRLKEGFDLLRQDDIEDQNEIEKDEEADTDPFEFGIEKLHKLEESLEKKKNVRKK